MENLVPLGIRTAEVVLGATPPVPSTRLGLCWASSDSSPICRLPVPALAAQVNFAPPATTLADPALTHTMV
jgi:hypothetical protein